MAINEYTCECLDCQKRDLFTSPITLPTTAPTVQQLRDAVDIAAWEYRDASDSLAAATRRFSEASKKLAEAAAAEQAARL